MGHPGLPGFIHKAINNSRQMQLNISKYGSCTIFTNYIKKLVIHQDCNYVQVSFIITLLHIFTRHHIQKTQSGPSRLHCCYIYDKSAKITVQGDEVDLMMKYDEAFMGFK